MDDIWFCNDAYTISKDEAGNTNNVMHVFSKPATVDVKVTAKQVDVCGARSKPEHSEPAVERGKGGPPFFLRLLVKILLFWKK